MRAIKQVITVAVSNPVPKNLVCKALEVPWKTRMWAKLRFLLIMRIVTMVIYLGFGLIVWIGIKFSSRDPSRYSLRNVLLKWPLAYVKVFGVLKE